MTQPIAREIKAQYAFAGPGVEIDKTLPLEPGEEPILQGRVYVAYAHRPAAFAAIGYVRLTTTRLCVNRLRMLTANRILEIPKGAFVSSTYGHILVARRTRLRVTFVRAKGPDTVSLLSFASLRPGVDTRGGFQATFKDHHQRVEGDPMEQLAAALTTWATAPAP